MDKTKVKLWFGDAYFLVEKVRKTKSERNVCDTCGTSFTAFISTLKTNENEMSCVNHHLIGYLGYTPERLEELNFEIVE